MLAAPERLDTVLAQQACAPKLLEQLKSKTDHRERMRKALGNNGKAGFVLGCLAYRFLAFLLSPSALLLDPLLVHWHHSRIHPSNFTLSLLQSKLQGRIVSLISTITETSE